MCCALQSHGKGFTRMHGWALVGALVRVLGAAPCVVLGSRGAPRCWARLPRLCCAQAGERPGSDCPGAAFCSCNVSVGRDVLHAPSACSYFPRLSTSMVCKNSDHGTNRWIGIHPPSIEEPSTTHQEAAVRRYIRSGLVQALHS